MGMRKLHCKVMPALLSAVFLVVFLGGCTQKKSVAQQEPAKAELEVWTFFDKKCSRCLLCIFMGYVGRKIGYDINVKSYSTEQLKIN